MDAAFRRFLFAYDCGLPLDMVLHSCADERGCLVERLEYRSVHDQRVPALLALPKDLAAPAPVVLVQHGGNRSKDERLVATAMVRFAKAGFASLAIDAPDHGERASSAPVASDADRRRLPYRQRDNRVQNVIDLRRGIDYLETRPEVDASRLGFWGISMGASLGVQLLAVDARPRVACLLLGGGGYRRAPAGLDPAEAELLRQVIDPLPFAGDIGGRPVLMLNGLEDESVPRGASEALHDALAGPKEVRWFQTGHNVTAGMLRASAEFFTANL